MNRSNIFLGMFLALGMVATAMARPSDQAAARAKQLKAGIKSFRLELLYYGDEDKPFYRLTLSVPPIEHDRSSPFYRIAQISQGQAEKIVAHLVESGFLDRAKDIEAIHPNRAPLGPRYILNVRVNPGKPIVFQEDLGWGLPMLKQLDGLRGVLEDDAGKGMDFLIGRLSGWRKLWEKEAASDWKKLYADQDWYKKHKQPEEVFRGTLQRHREPEVSTPKRPHRYKLGDRDIYPGKEHPELEKLIGQKVEVRGKRYDYEVELEVPLVREIWPAAIRAAREARRKTGVDQPSFTFSTGGRYHFEGFGEWVVTLTDTGVMSVTHWVRDTKKRSWLYTLNERELADLKALVRRAESSGLKSSTRPGVPDSVKWTVSFKGKDGLTTYRIWEKDARKKAELRQLAARLGTLVRTYTKQQPVGFPKAEKGS